MSFGLKGGRPKNKKQGAYWVQRHRDGNRASKAKWNGSGGVKPRPDLLGWIFIIGIAAVIVAWLG